MTRLRNLPPAEVKKFIWIFYAIGLLGLGIPLSREIFQALIPVHLLVALLVLLITDRSELKKVIPYSVIVFFLSFGLEAIGVNSGKIFGDFSYGWALGPKLFDTPLVIGWNWLMLLYLATIAVGSITKDRYVMSFLVAVIMVVYDFLLERPAGYLEMWTWSSDAIPLQNYLSWFIISWVFSGALQMIKPRLINPVASTMLGVQMLFFLLLNVIFYFEKVIAG